MYAPCLELNFLMCIWHSSRKKQQPLNHWGFLYMAIVLARKVTTTSELDKSRSVLSPIAPSQSPRPCRAVATPGRERPFLSGSPPAVDFAVPFVQPKQCCVTGDRASWALNPFTSCSQKGFPPTPFLHPLFTSLVHRTFPSDLALLRWHALSRRDSRSALVASSHVALKWIGKDYISAYPVPCCPDFLPPPAHCTTRLGLGETGGTAEARVAGRKAEVLWFTRWAWTRLGYGGLGERRPVVFFLAVSAPALPCRSEHSAAIFPCIKWS